jgi:hypothetical protein
MNAILPEGLCFFHFLQANLKIIIIKWLSRLSGTSQQKVKSQINSASSATRAQRAVKENKSQAVLVISAFEYTSNVSK